MIPVFVYGTLLTGESNHHVVASYVRSVRPGVVHGSLYDVGAYPALVQEHSASGRMVEGEWLLVEDAGLIAMDELEEYYGPGQSNDYERVWIRDAADESLEGWVYVWASSRGCPLIDKRSWREHCSSRSRQ
ncbi:gamma-glutamylcyclotransferase [Paenibacillus sp. YYML68]|uniref:gamma-glutamylcyclotransferase family protein n=1 Tax=Paenibacillus sp. YYML68 TaxID=2909250 RepID=UPI002492C389|nr:gamma-glutamylcyclotransferase family protein [Paenibacillus sp. YYML68]